MVFVDIAGLTFSSKDIGIIAAGLFGLAITLWLIRGFLLQRTLFKLCGVPTSSYKLMGSTLLWPGRPIKLVNDNLHGTPSSVFLKKDGKTAYVCQYNPRDFKGRVKVRERYQMLLFMGMVMEKYKPDKMKGAISYRDHLEFIMYEPVIYNQLLKLQDEYNEAIQDWVAPNIQPLFNRENSF